MLHVDKGLALNEQISRLLIARSALELWLHWTYICISPINQKMLLFHIFVFFPIPNACMCAVPLWKPRSVCCTAVMSCLSLYHLCEKPHVP